MDEKIIKQLTQQLGIRLDIGCGENKQPNWIGMDIRDVKGVDIVHDVQDIPYPLEDDSCFQILLSHLWEHTEPKFRIKIMDELWRIMKHEGQLLISVPYYLSFGATQDPTHYTCPSEATFSYFDPRFPLWTIYKPKPWKLVRNDYQLNGNLEIILEAQKDENYIEKSLKAAAQPSPQPLKLQTAEQTTTTQTSKSQTEESKPEITELGDTTIIKNQSSKPIRNRILVGTPTLGVIRVEWASSRYGQVIPCNWTSAGIHIGFNHTYPLGYLVADAQNILVDVAVRQNYEWLLFIEDDVIIPSDCFLKINEYMKDNTIPVVSGLYFLKSNPPEPLVYRGRGNGAFFDWKMGDRVWVDGVPTGCLLINCKVLKLMWGESPEYTTGNSQQVRRVFETPAKAWTDPETGVNQSAMGTSDLYWCDRVMREKVLQRAGYEEIGNKEYPFLVDTTIFCKHIDLNTGIQYPIGIKWDRK